MTALITLQDVHKIYDSGAVAVPALQGIDLAIEAGEFVAIVGASGSGKSTLLNVLGCLDRPTSGVYLLDGQDVSRLSRGELARTRNRKLGFVFQGFNLLKRYTALENVELPMLYARLPRGQCRPRAVELLTRVGLGERLDHRPNELSGGQQQRVAIARALANKPQVLLADEPTGNLDSHSGEDVLRLFQELNAQGQTVILVTHDPGIAAHARRVITVRDGLLASDLRGAA